MSVIRMHDKFRDRMLLVWLDSSEQGIYDATQVVCGTKLQADSICQSGVEIEYFIGCLLLKRPVV
jgi:hypothetical protein